MYPRTGGEFREKYVNFRGLSPHRGGDENISGLFVVGWQIVGSEVFSAVELISIYLVLDMINASLFCTASSLKGSFWPMNYLILRIVTN